MPNEPTLTPHDIRMLAAKAVTDERTIRAYLKDRTKVRSTSAVRIEAAMRELGLINHGKGTRKGLAMKAGAR